MCCHLVLLSAFATHRGCTTVSSLGSCPLCLSACKGCFLFADPFPVTEAEVKFKPLHCSSATWCERCARQSSFRTVFRERDLPTLTSRQAQRTGTEREDSGTASMCGKGTEKNQMAARLMSGCGAPFWRISAAHGWKRGPAPGEMKGMCCCCWGGPPK